MIREALLTPNEWSRPQYAMRRHDAIALHWVGNPGTTAEQTRHYFESLKDGGKYGSAHYVIDALETVRCVPDSEVAYHVGKGDGSYTPYAIARWAEGYSPNFYVLGIEMCHTDWSGCFQPEVLAKARILCAGLCLRYGITPDNIITHNMVTGKECPLWFVKHPEELDRFRGDVFEILSIG
jgi:N-acetylmuramoyl-L-alanine amidase CwlA